MSTEVEGAEPTVEPAVRRVFYVAAVLVFLAGVQLFVFPLRTDTYFAWTINSPMTAVFLGASYWSALGLELVAARATEWRHARIALPAVFVFTLTTLVVTLVHVDLFHFGTQHPTNTRLVTWAWLFVYALVPVLMFYALVRQRGSSTAIETASGLPAIVRLTLVGLTIVLVSLGAALLIAPEWADGAWPWTLTPLTARAIGAWLLGLGIAAAHARLADDCRSVLPLGITGVLFGVLQLIALLRHGDLLNRGTARTVGYLLVLAVLTAVSTWVVVGARATAVHEARRLDDTREARQAG